MLSVSERLFTQDFKSKEVETRSYSWDVCFTRSLACVRGLVRGLEIEPVAAFAVFHFMVGLD
jgi:hypothetical protein